MKGRMSDASDTIKKRKEQAQYVDKLAQMRKAKQACGEWSTCTTYVSACGLKFNSFEEKYNFFEGRNICIGCECPKTGGSK